MINNLSPEERKNLVSEFNYKRALWFAEYQERRNYVEKLRRIIEGKERKIHLLDAEGRVKETISIPYAFAILETLSQFMGLTPPEIDILPLDYQTNPASIFQVQQQENFLRQLLKATHFDTQYFIMSKTASWYGLGALRLFDISGMPKIEAIERPENLIIGWKADDFKDIEFYIFEYLLSPYQVKHNWGIDVKPEETYPELGPEKTSIPFIAPKWSRGGRTTTESFVTTPPIKYDYIPKGFVRVSYYVDDFKEMVIIKNRLVKYEEHNYGFVPLYPFRNIIMLGKPSGVSDYHAACDLEKLLLLFLDKTNEAVNENLKQLWVTNVPKLRKEDLQTDERTRNILVHLDTRRGEDLRNISPTAKINITELLEETQKIKSLISQLAFFPEQLFFSQGQETGLSGRAIRMIYTRVINLIKAKRQVLTPILENLIRDMVSILKEKGPKEAKELFEEFNNPIEFRFGSILPEEKAVEISNAISAEKSGLISKYTARKWIDVDDPLFEKFLIDVEKNEEILEQQRLEEEGIQQRKERTPSRLPVEEMPFEEGEGMPATEGEGGASSFITPEGMAREEIQHEEERRRRR